MANDSPLVPKVNNGGIGGVLTTLASSGDNWVKLLIVGGLILNGFWTKSNNSEIKTTKTDVQTNTVEIDKLRRQAIRQIKVVFDNQRVFADFMDETRAALDRMQTKLSIDHPPFQPYPRQEVPNYNAEEDNGN